MERELSEANANDLGTVGEEMGGCVQPAKHMIQVWHQCVMTDEPPAYVILYHNGAKWRQVPKATLRQAARRVMPEGTTTKALAAINIHAVVHTAIMITEGALALLKAIDDELTATGL